MSIEKTISYRKTGKHILAYTSYSYLHRILGEYIFFMGGEDWCVLWGSCWMGIHFFMGGRTGVCSLGGVGGP